MAKMIAYCGLNCAQCEAYIATQKNDKKGLAKIAKKWSKQFGEKMKAKDVICDGCKTPKGRKVPYCALCKIRVCAIEKGKVNCAVCEEYICGKLADFFKEAPEAKKNLGKIKKRA